jgi:predicted amidohydrolase
MRISIYQGPAEAGTVARNLDLLKARASEAASVGARLLICPEMFLTGYNIGPATAARLAEASDGRSLARAARIAQDFGIALLFGYPERGSDGAIYNTVSLIDRFGATLASYRKCHLFGELDRTMFCAGSGPSEAVELEGVRIGLLICYDVEFPETVRLLSLQGVDLVAVPTALMEPFEVVARTLVPARAVENQIYLAYANRCGREGDVRYCGLSCVVGPDGTELVRAGRGEDLVFADLDLDRLRADRTRSPYLSDRRPELYAPLADAVRAPWKGDAA